MIDRILRAMGGTVEDPAVQELLAALGSAPGKPAKPNKDGYVVAKKHGVELLFDASVTSDLYPLKKVNRKQVRYLCTCWIREEKYRGSWPEGYSPELDLAAMRKLYGEGFELWGGDWDEVREARWTVPVPGVAPGVVLHPTFHFNDRSPSLALSLDHHLGFFEYLDAERADPFAGFFVGWCAEHGLLHPALAERAAAAVAEVKARKKTGRELIVLAIDHRAWDGEHNHVWSCDLSPAHREFFHAYLSGVHTEELWGKYETSYQDDFRAIFGKRYRAIKEHPPRWEVVPDRWDHHDEIAQRISERYEAWQPRSRARRERAVGRA